MGDTVDVTGDNTLVLCFGFLFSKKQWLKLGKRIRIAYRNFFRFVNVMESFNDDLVNCRAGHVAVRYGTDSIIVWGGYKENPQEVDMPLEQEYWPTNQICLYNRLQQTWRLAITNGNAPPFSSGSTAVVHHNEFYVFFGFHHYTRNIANLNDEDLEDDERELRLQGVVEKNSNNAYVLNLNTLAWKKLNPSGKRPLRVDKLSSWIFDGKVYLFGGFGPPPDPSKDDLPNFVTHAVDPSTVHWGRRHVRGWTNQLVVYNIASNTWEWPNCSGDIPSPRAAHTCVANSQGDAFLFGGRHGSQRLNDLYHLDMRRKLLRWTLLQLNNPSTGPDVQIPTGRSWHTLSLVDDYHGVLYGGYDRTGHPVGDCWLVDLSPATHTCQQKQQDQGQQRWTRLRHLELGDLLWHCSVSLPRGQVYLVGGVENDLLNRSLAPIEHPKQVKILNVSPPPLLVIALEAAVRNYRCLKSSVPHLPVPLKMCLEQRRKKFIYDRDNRPIKV